MSSSSLTLSAAPGTGIWRKPPITDIFNAPINFTTTTPKPLAHLVSAKVTFSAAYVHQYDQAGLLILITPAPNVTVTITTSSTGTAPTTTTLKPKKWVKMGIEMFEGSPRVSTVACDRWADWGLVDVAGPATTAAAVAAGTTDITVLAERHVSNSAASLMIYRVLDDGEKMPLREVCWVFEDEADWEVQVGAYLARPENNVEGKLTAEFKQLDVIWAQ